VFFLDKLSARRIRLYTRSLTVLCHQLEEITAPALYDINVNEEDVRTQVATIRDNLSLLEAEILRIDKSK
jgi:Fe2+ or Zn2+ uptake regulation protein